MGEKSRGNYAQCQKISQERYDRIFEKKEMLYVPMPESVKDIVFPRMDDVIQKSDFE